jgi:hypothetical protein
MNLRLVLEDWQIWFPIVGFLVFVGAFVGIVIWVGRMKHPKVDHLEHLPLEEETARRVTHGHSD